MSTERHELFAFMRQVSSDMAAEYARISKRTKEDPGTAGDEGEENWATLLRSWLPAGLPVVTKGRLLGQDGTTSPQVDVVVLSANYPTHLRNKKLYFSAGVLAAFECKLNLRPRHLGKLAATAKAIKTLEEVSDDPPNLYEDANARILYGLLSHAHAWGNKPDPRYSILRAIDRAILSQPGDVRWMPDVICISNLATICLNKTVHTTRSPSSLQYLEELGTDIGIAISYDSHGDGHDERKTPQLMGALLGYLMHKLAYNDHSLRGIASYWARTGIFGVSLGRVSVGALDLDAEVVESLQADSGGSKNAWNPWGPDL